MSAKIFTAIAALVVLVLMAAAAFTYTRWHQSQYFGQITRIDGSLVTLSDAKAGERKVHVGPDTFIRKGPAAGAQLKLGDHVMVIGEIEKEIIEASLIRIVEEPIRAPRPGK